MLDLFTLSTKMYMGGELHVGLLLFFKTYLISFFHLFEWEEVSWIGPEISQIYCVITFLREIIQLQQKPVKFSRPLWSSVTIRFQVILYINTSSLLFQTEITLKYLVRPYCVRFFLHQHFYSVQVPASVVCSHFSSVECNMLCIWKLNPFLFFHPFLSLILESGTVEELGHCTSHLPY